jgi:hypothetical protein
VWSNEKLDIRLERRVVEKECGIEYCREEKRRG